MVRHDAAHTPIRQLFRRHGCESDGKTADHAYCPILQSVITVKPVLRINKRQLQDPLKRCSDEAFFVMMAPLLSRGMKLAAALR